MKHMKRMTALLLSLILCTTCLSGLVFADTTGVPKITLGETIAEPDSDVVVEVKLAENPGLMAMLFTVSYEHELLTLTGVEDGGLTGWELSGDKVLWLGDADSSYNGTVLKLCFHVAATAPTGDIPVTLTCGNGDVGNHDEQAYIPTIAAGKVHLHDYALSGWSWTDYSAAKANFVCKHDASHTVSVDATITSVRTEPTADANGSVVYTAKVTFEGKDYTDVQTEVIPALGREYELVGWSWSDDFTTASATFTDKNGSGDITVGAQITVERTEPGCETAGKAVYTATVTLSGKTYTDTKTKTLDALDHNWGEPTYEWTENNGKVTATRVCQRDGSHIETETVDTTGEVTKNATCEGWGETTYTATFTNPAFAKQTKTVANIEPIGHDWGEPVWSWAADYATATATFTCKHNTSHTATVDATITSVRTEPTADANGSVVYTAKVTFDGKDYANDQTEVIPALGREYELVGWNWSDDFTTASATFTDKNGSGDITVGAQVTVERTEPGCETAGKEVYTATVTLSGKTYTDTKTKTLDALDHNWGEPTYVWAEDYATCTATRICKNDTSHKETETVAATSEVTKEATADEEGEITYTAKFQNPVFGTQTKAVATPKLDQPVENPFVDVHEDDWFYNAVMWAISRKPVITNGTDATHFAPTKTCTRAEVVQFLWNASGKPDVPATDNPFVDVHTSDWFYTAVMWAVANGVTNGTDATHFAPAKKCTRAEVVTFLRNASDDKEVTNTNNPFTDVKSSDWYYNSVLWAVERGVTSGTTPTTFAPTKTCTRAEVVQFLYKYSQTK